MSVGTVLVIDDHPIMRDALRHIAHDLFSELHFMEAESLSAALPQLDSATPDLVLLDLCLPGSDDVTVLEDLRARCPDPPVVVISHIEDLDTVREVIRLGAAGFVPKSESRAVILAALQLVLSGGVYLPPNLALQTGEVRSGNLATVPTASAETGNVPLTGRQRTVLELMEQGLSNKHIARELGVSEWTVKAHVSAILRKLGVSTRVEAVVAAAGRR